MIIVEQSFNSEGDLCMADLYLPEELPNPPVVVMAHGFAAERSFGLSAFAEKFCDLGIAVLMFDYRGFGDSEGSPRQWVDPKRHLQDWRAAIAHARSLGAVNSDKLAIWGTSFSGGHVVSIAAKDSAISALIAQVPFVSGKAQATAPPVSEVLALAWSAVVDSCRAALGLSPKLYPVIAGPGERAIMNTPECLEGYRRLVPDGSTWQNAVPARIGLRIPFYSPADTAADIGCPSLIIAAKDDSLIPVEAVQEMASRIQLAEYHELDCNHFEPYVEPHFTSNIALQQRFLTRHLLNTTMES